MTLAKRLSKVVQAQPKTVTTIFEEANVELIFNPNEGIYALKNGEKHPIHNIFKAEQIFESLLPEKKFVVPSDNVGPLFERFDKTLDLKPIVVEGRIKGFKGDGISFYKDGVVIFEKVSEKNYSLLDFIQKNQIGKRKEDSNV